MNTHLIAQDSTKVKEYLKEISDYKNQTFHMPVFAIGEFVKCDSLKSQDSMCFKCMIDLNDAFIGSWIEKNDTLYYKSKRWDEKFNLGYFPTKDTLSVVSYCRNFDLIDFCCNSKTSRSKLQVTIRKLNNSGDEYYLISYNESSFFNENNGSQFHRDILYRRRFGPIIMFQSKFKSSDTMIFID